MIGTLAIIPAKAKSERLPSKNMKRVGPHTLVERAIHSAVTCDAVAVCSDDADILSHGRAFADRLRVRYLGVQLDESLTGKRVHLEDVIAHVVALHPARRYVLLQPTSPLRQRRHVASALAIMERTGCDSVISVHEVTKDVYFAGYYDADGRWHRNRPAHRMFTSELPKLVAENGAVYAFTADCWRKYQDRSGGDCRVMEMDVDAAIDIDTPAELERAQRRHRWQEEA